MSNMKKRYTAAAAMMMVLGMCASASAAFDENLNDYTLDTMVVEADAIKNKFGDTITEQSYYRTGGDVKVISREEIEKRHYTDVTEAIKRIPGVTFQNPGYRGGEYGYAPYNNSMSINGDSRVIILVDGRRVDNSTSTRFGTSSASGTRTMADLNQVVSIDSVDKIEVIKGPGASVYGADATGGVINIITRKGSVENKGTIDLSTGSWHKHIYNITYSGSAGDDKSWHYFVSATRNMASNSKYKDGLTGNNYTYEGTNYKEEGVNLRIDKDFNDKQNLKIWYNHQNGKDGYPITAPDYRYWNATEWNRIIADTEAGKFGNTKNPGYRNLFVLDALSGSFNQYRNNDIDVTYTFDKDNGMDSFIRVYDQKHHYNGLDWYPDWVQPDGSYLPFPGTPGWNAFDYYFSPVHPASYTENNRGVQVQYGKSVGVNDILASVTYDRGKTDSVKWQRAAASYKTTVVERDSILGYIQDKIHINNKWDLTPALRYSRYSTFDTKTENGTTSNNNSDSSYVTPTITTQYAFDDTMSAYLGWTKIKRPVKSKDYTTTVLNGGTLKDESGNVWTFGLRKDIDEKTSVAAHYDLTDMSNAVTSYSIWAPNEHGVYDYRNKSINAKEKKKSFNVTVDHQFDENWSLGLAYTHLKDEWKAKDGMNFDPDISLDKNSNVNTMINSLRPANHYTANLSYEKDKWYTGLLVNWYTGMSTEAFTNNRALVLDWSLNYEVNKDLTTYLTISNLTNEGYENAYSAYNGVGAAPQPGRCIMVGMKYSF
ncbi:TonB-dependent receptor [Phascolarctobacterium sp.]